MRLPASLIRAAAAALAAAACAGDDRPRDAPAAGGGVSASAPTGAAPSGGAARQPNDAAGPSPGPDSLASGRFVVEDRGRVIVRVDGPAPGTTHAPVLRVSEVPAEWEPGAGARFGVGADSFHFAAADSAGQLVAWQAGGTHALLGVVSAGGGAPRVLDFFFDSRADSVAWAPGGRYLIARYTGPSARRRRGSTTRARRAARGAVEQGCGPAQGCDVVEARWTGASTAEARTATGGVAAPRAVPADAATLGDFRPRR